MSDLQPAITHLSDKLIQSTGAETALRYATAIQRLASAQRMLSEARRVEATIEHIRLDLEQLRKGVH